MKILITLIAATVFFTNCSSIHSTKIGKSFVNLTTKQYRKNKSSIQIFPNGGKPFELTFEFISKDKFPARTSLNKYDLSDNNLNYFTNQGYVLIGNSEFISTYYSYQEAVNLGCEIGASVLLYRYDYYGTESGTSVGRVSNGDSRTYQVQSSTKTTYSGVGNYNYSAVGNNGYAFGYGNSNLSGQSKSTTQTTIYDPGTFSYVVVPYEYNYYKQEAVYLVKKYYWLDNSIALYDNSSLTKASNQKIEKGKLFEILNWCSGKTAMKIKFDSKHYYLSCSDLKSVKIH